MEDLIADLKGILKKDKSSQATPYINKKGFSAVQISKENFHEIAQKPEGSFCFVDGGNAELIDANNLSLQYVRVAAIKYLGLKRQAVEKEEYFVLVNFKDGRFFARTYPDSLSFEISADDEALRDGKSMSKISRIAGFMRRVLELRLADKASPGSEYVVLDGLLEEKFALEKEYLDKLFLNANTAGFCKTNNMITRDGRSVSNVLFQTAQTSEKKNCWIYSPIAVIDRQKAGFDADIIFCRLHERSNHAFRVDLHIAVNDSEIDADVKKKDFFEKIMPLCADPVFFGYPYGLIEADRIARVSNVEKEYHRTRLMAKLGKDWGDVSLLEKSSDAHSILDNI